MLQQQPLPASSCKHGGQGHVGSADHQCMHKHKLTQNLVPDCCNCAGTISTWVSRSVLLVSPRSAQWRTSPACSPRVLGPPMCTTAPSAQLLQLILPISAQRPAHLQAVRGDSAQVLACLTLLPLCTVCCAGWQGTQAVSAPAPTTHPAAGTNE